MDKLHLGAYQMLTLHSEDLGDQYTESGSKPRTLIVQLTTAIDEAFINRTVTALLTEDAQRSIIRALNANLNGIDL